MQSVYKFPLAVAMLHQIDKGKFTLDQKIHIAKTDLLPHMWSPLQKKYPNGNVDVTLREILSYTVSQSDNNGCDILFRLLGGPKEVEKYIHGIGVKDIAIVATEEEMHREWPVQFTNWCRPMSMVQLLDLFFQKNILSQPSKEFLWKIMMETITGRKRIKGLLPEGTIVGHKTGTGGRDDNGVLGAINVVGIMVLPNGDHVALAFFVGGTSARDEACEDVIAKISKVVYDYYIK
jgi:beta-lactamase class A